MSRKVIRPALQEELPILIDLGRRSWLSAFAQTAPFDLIAWWTASDRTRHLYQEGWAQMLVLEVDGAIVGLVQPSGSEINGLWVHPAHQGQGAGTLLLRAGEQAIQRAGHQHVWLICSGWNLPALAFYQRRGYIETDRKRFLHAPSGVEVSEVRLERALEATADDPPAEGVVRWPIC